MPEFSIATRLTLDKARPFQASVPSLKWSNSTDLLTLQKCPTLMK